MNSNVNYRRRAIQLLLAPTYVMGLCFFLERFGLLQRWTWLGNALAVIYFAVGAVVLIVSLLAILRMKRSREQRLLYMILTVLLYVPYMLLPIALFILTTLYLPGGR